MQPFSNMTSTVDPYNIQQSYEPSTFQGQPFHTSAIDVDSGEDVEMLFKDNNNQQSSNNEQIMKEKELEIKVEEDASISNLFSSGENSEDDDIQQTTDQNTGILQSKNRHQSSPPISSSMTPTMPKIVHRDIPIGKPLNIQFKSHSIPAKNKKFYLLRLPSSIKIEPQPFQSEDYIPTNDKLIKNWIRWRISTDVRTNEIYKETNTKLIEWENGSLSLKIGSEIFDLNEQMIDGHRDFLFTQMNTVFNDTANSGNSQKRLNGNFQMCSGSFTGRLNVRNSNFQDLKSLTDTMVARHKAQTIAKALANKHRVQKFNKYKMKILEKRKIKEMDDVMDGRNEYEYENDRRLNVNRNQRNQRKRKMDDVFLERSERTRNESSLESESEEEYGSITDQSDYESEVDDDVPLERRQIAAKNILH